MAMMNLSEMKNDTARKNAIRRKLAEVVYWAIAEEFGEDNTRFINDKITVGGDIAGNTVAVCVGSVIDKDGCEVDAVATISATVKSWNTTTNKSGTTIYSVNMDDIDTAIETANGERAEKERIKAEEKKKKEEEKARKKAEKSNK